MFQYQSWVTNRMRQKKIQCHDTDIHIRITLIMGIISYIPLLLENSRIDNSDQKREFRICCIVELILLLLGLIIYNNHYFLI